MQMVLLTALGVGSATVIGALLGFLVKHPSQKFNDIYFTYFNFVVFFRDRIDNRGKYTARTAPCCKKVKKHGLFTF